MLSNTDNLPHKYGCFLDIRVQALSEFWSANDNSRENDQVRETGLLGSLRWWYEALIRALGYYACDPTDDNARCPVEDNQHNKIHCAACELFGCTGRQRKFILRVCRSNGTPVDGTLAPNEEYIWRFIPLREVDPVEWFLLERVIRLACDYASFGAKNVLKPSEDEWKNSDESGDNDHHKDYGLFKWTKKTYDSKPCRYSEIDQYLGSFRKKRNNSLWPDLRYFWSVKGYTLLRDQYNEMLKFDSWKVPTYNGKTRPAYKNCDPTGGNPQPETWLRGFSLFPSKKFPDEDTPGSNWESKKIFSFHTEKGKRTWGYTQAKYGDLHWKQVMNLFKSQASLPKLHNVVRLSDLFESKEYFGFKFPQKGEHK